MGIGFPHSPVSIRQGLFALNIHSLVSPGAYTCPCHGAYVFSVQMVQRRKTKVVRIEPKALET